MKKLILVVLCLCLVTQSGCWDQREINQLGFTLAVALDPVSNEEDNGEMQPFKRFNSTFQVAVPGDLAESTEGASGGQPFFNITSSDITNFKTVRNVAERRSRKLFFEHLKAIIINEDLIKEGSLEHILDLYLRDHEMRRRIRVLISQGPARDIISEKLPLENMPGMSIDMIREFNSDITFAMIEPKELGEISSFIKGDESFLLAGIIKDTELKVSGAAIIKGKENKMIGWLNEKDVSGYNLILGESQKGIVNVPYEESGLFVFELDRLVTTFDYERKNDQPHFHITIKSEGMFSESWIHDPPVNDTEGIKKLEAAAEQEIVRQAEHTLEKMQNEYYVDVFRLWREVKTNDNKYWKTIEGNWDGKDGVFSNASITVSAEVKIRHYMLNEGMES
ncbi:Ger(x)C family spore germination protein [Evansella sp. LMS18]|uniref:Ger(x)C family spore germination protein n=1 Tax=Evansella sp. LMS18 TaxID=2924033 RepID=UPI0020D09EDF|nr:Ger(x)C family spore germination protein [Evansella sp. LMS18]UTR10087.1 Ger(x)C family spore germination protein [Evansella sp. LMS18]